MGGSQNADLLFFSIFEEQNSGEFTPKIISKKNGNYLVSKVFFFLNDRFGVKRG